VTRVLERSWELPGIIVLEEPLRRYPYGKLAAHVLGHVGAVTEEELKQREDLELFDWTGKMGLERVYDKFLQGEHGREIVEVDARGAPIRRIRREPAQPGQVLVTTLDLELQKVAEASLQGKRGAVVAIDPRNGEVLVMASSPTFDPNWFSKGIKPELWRWLVSHKAHPMQNRAIATAHPPGSTFKVVTATAALIYGKATPQNTHQLRWWSHRRAQVLQMLAATWNGGHGEGDWTILRYLLLHPRLGYRSGKVGTHCFFDGLGR